MTRRSTRATPAGVPRSRARFTRRERRTGKIVLESTLLHMLSRMGSAGFEYTVAGSKQIDNCSLMEFVFARKPECAS